LISYAGVDPANGDALYELDPKYPYNDAHILNIRIKPSMANDTQPRPVGPNTNTMDPQYLISMVAGAITSDTRIFTLDMLFTYH
jgi:hypothetical protein